MGNGVLKLLQSVTNLDLITVYYEFWIKDSKYYTICLLLQILCQYSFYLTEVVTFLCYKVYFYSFHAFPDDS